MRGLKYISFHDESASGVVARRLITACVEQGTPITWTPMVPGRGWGMAFEPFFGRGMGDDRLAPVCNCGIEYDRVVIHLPPAYFGGWLEREGGARIIGYTVPEPTGTSKRQISTLNRLDRLLVPYRSVQARFEEIGVVVPTEVIPPIAQRPAPADFDELLDISSSEMIFYTVGDWTQRKAIHETLGCYWNVFTAADPTVLVIKTSQRDMTRTLFGRCIGSADSAVKRLAKRYSSPARIKLIAGEITGEQLTGLHRRGDCYVSLAQNDGWGIDALDAASAGTPVVMAEHGGPAELMDRDLAYLIHGDVEPDPDHAAEQLRSVFDRRDLARDKGRRLQQGILARLTPLTVTGEFIRAISKD
jgi:glycosyltransferase involved in cell wall biosynthesis